MGNENDVARVKISYTIITQAGNITFIYTAAVFHRHLSVRGWDSRGLCMMSLPVWLPGPMFLPGGLSLVPCSSGGGCVLSKVFSGDLCPDYDF